MVLTLRQLYQAYDLRYPGDPVDLSQRYRRLAGSFPQVRVLGGCCGTDHRHIKAICEAVTPAAAA